MNKYKVLKQFVDVHSKLVVQVGQEIELTDERAQEIETNLEKYGGGFIELVEPDEEVKEVKQKKTTTKAKG